jgi:dipeptidyl aminopeptidase/acylaminoacyl peptidase
MTIRAIKLVFAGSLLCATSFAQRPMTLVDLINLPQVTDPQLSPDGQQVLFVKSEANWKANRRVGHIWKISADGTGLMQMTAGADGENSPRWSPDGKSIAFLAKRAPSLTR